MGLTVWLCGGVDISPYIGISILSKGRLTFVGRVIKAPVFPITRIIAGFGSLLSFFLITQVSTGHWFDLFILRRCLGGEPKGG
jgi:hypothetical protein